MIFNKKQIFVGLILISVFIIKPQTLKAYSSGIDRINRGISLMNEWGDWYISNQSRLEYPRVRPTKKTLEVFFKSIEFSNRAVNIINPKGYQYMTKGNIDKVIDLRSQALKYAKSINISEMNSWYPNFGNMFKTKFIAGLEEYVSGLSEESKNLFNVSPSNYPKLNVNELDIISKILSKAMVQKLNSDDLFNLDRTLSSYDKRTGTRMKKVDIEEIMKYFKILNDYNYELGYSLLLSWDCKKVSISDDFNRIFKLVKENDLRSSDKLKMDIIALDAASKNQRFVMNDKKQKFEFGRGIILKKLKENEIEQKNLELIMKVFEKHCSIE